MIFFWKVIFGETWKCLQSNLILSWSVNCFIVAGTEANQVPTFAITDIKLYVPAVTLLTQDNAANIYLK